MSSRQEEKQRRREEREAQERATAKGAARIRRLQIVVGAVLAVAVVVAIAIAVTSGGGNGDKSGAKPEGKASIPKAGKNAKDLTAAAAAASCKVTNPANEGSTHVPDSQAVTYKNSNPPASGNHHAVPAQDGFYDPGQEPAKEAWVHSLEHGRIIIQYRAGSPKPLVNQLETVGSESDGYHVLVMENNTKMPYAVAAVAWTHVLGCQTMNPRVFDAIRAFRNQYVDQGPERIP